eukprot:GEMP01036407.1.p1 GENE.GEMP01036407.1~~GEMP01036407.1.p1  ORF type:complete len:209 (+),score=25.35 GEMP01036407.1:35-628(+)
MGARERIVYGKVSADSDSDDEQLDARELAKKKWVKRLDTLWIKINAAFWIAVACGVIWYTNFFRVIWEHPAVRRPYLNLAFCCLGFNMSLLFYLSVYLDMFKKSDVPSEQQQPKAIPAMILAAVLSFILFAAALWPVWGFYIVLIQFSLFLGYINSGHFLPSGHIGTLMYFVIFFAAFFTAEYIPHEGLAHTRFEHL